MQQNQEKNPLEKLYDELPKNVQEAISSVAVAEKIQEIAKRNGLHIDEAGIVSDEATMVMLGIEHPNDFVDGLKNKLKLPQEKIVTLAKDVDKEIFEPIKESLMKIYEDQEIADDYAFTSQISAPARHASQGDAGGDETTVGENKIDTPTKQSNTESIIPINNDGSIRLEVSGPRDQKENTNIERLSNNILVPNNLPVEKKLDLVPVGNLNKKDFSPEYSEKVSVLGEDAIFQSKIGSVVNLPREETIIKQEVPMENKIKHIDPYRETVE